MSICLCEWITPKLKKNNNIIIFCIIIYCKLQHVVEYNFWGLIVGEIDVCRWLWYLFELRYGTIQYSSLSREHWCLSSIVYEKWGYLLSMYIRRYKYSINLQYIKKKGYHNVGYLLFSIRLFCDPKLTTAFLSFRDCKYS